MTGLFAQLGVRAGSPAHRLDPLLTAARVLLYVFVVGVALAFAFKLFGLVAYVLVHFRDLSAGGNRASWEVVGAHLFGLGAIGLVLSSIVALLSMIGAVEAGEPFAEANGKRLEKIAGNALGLQLIGLIAAWAGSPIRGDVNGLDIAPRLTPAGIAVVLLLFILARLFRHGAALREDLEGTV